MEVRLLVTMQVDSDDELTEEESNVAAHDAVYEALNYAQNRGFNHAHADVASVGLAAVDFMQECHICGNEVVWTILVMAIDGANATQPLGLEGVCQHCYETECEVPGWGWSNDWNDPQAYEGTPDGWKLKEGRR